jgi:hypothetical protein
MKKKRKNPNPPIQKSIKPPLLEKLKRPPK